MINAYITMQGVVSVKLATDVPALGGSSSDEYALRRLFLNQQSFYTGKKIPGEVVGVIKGDSARATLFDDGSASVYFWSSKKTITVKWTRV